MGERLKAARVEKKLTLEKLSEKIGISRNFLWEIEAGRKAPAINTLFCIGKVLNISIDYILGLSVDKKWLDSETEDSKISKICSMMNNMDDAELKFFYKVLCMYFEEKR